MSAPAAYELIVRDGPNPGSRVAIPQGRATLGSAADCALRFPANLVRERHAELRCNGSTLEVVDLTGANLVWVNGQPATQAALQHGSELRLGRLTLVVSNAPMADWNERTISSARRQLATPGPSAVGAMESVTVEPTAISGRFAAGELIDGRYKIVARLAAGGMGEVFKVEHVELGKTLALKVMLPGLSEDPDFVNRFKLEAVAASRIGHPNIVDITDFGKTATGRFYFVMEYLDGATLAKLVETEGPLHPARAADLTWQVARALAAAHELQIVHRDLKPENVIVIRRANDPEHVKVLDFGVARVQLGNASAGKTQAGIVVGTPQYMSPEQAQGLVVDARSDIYALGLILYELLSRVPPFTGETPHVVMVKQVTEPPPPLPDEVPEPLKALVARMLAKKAADRVQTMKEVVDTLDRLRLELKPGAKPARAPAAKRAQKPAAEATAIKPSAPRPAPGPVPAPAPAPEPAPTLADVNTAGLRSSTPKTLALVLAGLVVVLLGASAVLLKSDPPTPPPAPEPLAVEPEKPVEPPPAVKPVEPATPQPSEVVMRLESTPPGVEVFEDGVMLGNTPLPLKRAPNTVHLLTFSLAGYQTAQRKVMVSEEPTTVSVTLEKEKASAPVVPVKPGKKDPPPRPKLDLKPAPF